MISVTIPGEVLFFLFVAAILVPYSLFLRAVFKRIDAWVQRKYFSNAPREE